MSEAPDHEDTPTGTDETDPVGDDLAAEAGTDLASSEVPAGGTEDSLEDLFEKDLTSLAAERDEYLDSLRRLQADFDNYRKRALRRETEMLERAAERLLVQLLPVLDALDLAEAHRSSDEATSDDALGQIGTLLRATVEREGLERIDDVDVAFDPTVHDAVAHEEAEGDETGDTTGPSVSEVMRAGYRLKGRVIRPAMVKVTG